jgi:mRNA interferase RelE/StbE
MSAIRYDIEYGDSALGDLEDLPPKQRAQILRKIERLRHGLHGDIKRLRESDVTYRLRMGDYRILFDVKENVIVVRRIGHRKSIYE